jgi:hypothetical protein
VLKNRYSQEQIKEPQLILVNSKKNLFQTVLGKNHDNGLLIFSEIHDNLCTHITSTLNSEEIYFRKKYKIGRGTHFHNCRFEYY